MTEVCNLCYSRFRAPRAAGISHHGVHYAVAEVEWSGEVGGVLGSPPGVHQLLPGLSPSIPRLWGLTGQE